MLEWLKTPAVVALISAVPAVVTFVLGYVRTSRAAQHAATSEGWRALIDNLRAENQELRKQITALLAERDGLAKP